MTLIPMSKISSVIQARQHNYTTLRAAFRSENGAIDLASIMVGIIVIGLIGGVIAATVFAVIPWAQDNAAKQQLDSIHTAENASYGLSADPTVTTDQTKRNMFTDSLGLETAKLLAQNANYCVVPSADGKDYTAYVKSASGKIWTAMNSAKKATVLSGTPTGACSTLATDTNGTNTVSANGGVVTTYSAANWAGTQGLAITADRIVYATPSSTHSIRKLAADGTITTLAGNGTLGFADGQGSAARFNNPIGVTLGPDGNLYVADFGNNRVRTITPAGVVSTLVGSSTAGGTDGNISSATLNGPIDIAFDSLGNKYIAEYSGKKVRKITPAGVVSTLATLSGPIRSLDVDAVGNVYASIETINITKVTPAGGISVFATSGTNYYGLAMEQATGILYAVNSNNTIEMLLSDGTKTILAGTAGQAGNVNGTGAAARFANPYSIALDSTGALIVGSVDNNVDLTLRMIK